jgi:hypothetical protein
MSPSWCGPPERIASPTPTRPRATMSVPRLGGRSSGDEPTKISSSASLIRSTLVRFDQNWGPFGASARRAPACVGMPFGRDSPIYRDFLVRLRGVEPPRTLRSTRPQPCCEGSCWILPGFLERFAVRSVRSLSLNLGPRMGPRVRCSFSGETGAPGHGGSFWWSSVTSTGASVGDARSFAVSRRTRGSAPRSEP